MSDQTSRNSSLNEEKKSVGSTGNEASTSGEDKAKEEDTKHLSDEGDDADTEEEDDGPESWLEKLQNFFKAKLHLDDEEDVAQVLEELSVDGIVKYIKSGECKNIITMAGAGISTSAGIPDFRSPESGLYNNLQKYDLPYPEAIFDIEFFRKNPKPFFVLAKELYPGAFNPTPSHYFIKLLNDRDLLYRHYTQNIDTLEHVAGIPADKLVEAHGTFRTSHCLTCRKEYELEWMKTEIFADRVPCCTDCTGLVKPDIVFFRESLPPRFFQMMSQDFRNCDLLIVMGTSLTVQPFASLLGNVPPTCPRLLINREKVGADSLTYAFQGLFGGSGGFQSDSSGNKRDVAMIGDCDDMCKILAEKLGWKDDLEKLMSQNDEGSAGKL